MKKENLALATLAMVTATVLPNVVSAAELVAAGGAGGATTYTTAAGSFVKESFIFNTSASVGLNAVETSSIMAVSTIHSDGQYLYTGSSEGGSVDTCGSKLAPTDAKTLTAPVTTSTGGCSSS